MKFVYEQFSLGQEVWCACEYDSRSRLFYGFIANRADHNLDGWAYFSLDDLISLKDETGEEVERRWHPEKPGYYHIHPIHHKRRKGQYPFHSKVILDAYRLRGQSDFIKDDRDRVKRGKTPIFGEPRRWKPVDKDAHRR